MLRTERHTAVSNLPYHEREQILLAENIADSYGSTLTKLNNRKGRNTANFDNSLLLWAGAEDILDQLLPLRLVLQVPVH